MESELFTALVNQGGIASIMAIGLFMVYRAGKFFAPVITGYLSKQVENQTIIANTQGEIATTQKEIVELQKAMNTRLEAIERQLSVYKDWTT